ncbi:hypothetical protein PIB19_02570 [Sphingomonas sp. 7/4-4]|uniref:hypothetical protein n=1 Tax=Sphingomonas sp. 7/4-4 TaxID=3018446 RepID=UPI0022F3EAA4|nr:hypothetical protein [Sphingomonas sp. 7/4-4]WBY08413.1 hypothetical protein PIB19_02570 [Sphingomonas sp. 7/4-4]
MTRLALFAAAAVATLLLASPYLLLDYPAVVRDLAGEARPMHPGATGGGFFVNLAWYVGHPLLGSLGVGGLALSAFGIVLMALRNRTAAVAVLPGIAAFAVLISIQALRWERWLIPLLPLRRSPWDTRCMCSPMSCDCAPAGGCPCSNRSPLCC